MEKKRILTLMVFVLLLFSGFLLYFLIYVKEPSIQGNAISDDRDEHGCLFGSGFTWNVTEQSCVREWLTGDLRYQIVDFQSCSDAGYALSENNSTKLLQCQTPNGTVFSENSSAVNVTINNSNSIGNGNTTFVGNFNITNNTISNSTNSSLNLTSNS